jgi:hypothetical protein
MKRETLFYRLLATLLLIGLFIVLIFAKTAAASTDVSLTRLLYNVRDDFSRLTFFFNGPVVYSAEQRGGRVYLYFSDIDVASPPGLSAFDFQTGLISGTNLSEIADRSVQAVVHLRDNAWHSIVQDNETQRILVYVFPASMQPGTRTASRFAIVGQDPVPGPVYIENRPDPIHPADTAAVKRAAAAGARENAGRAGVFNPLVLIFSMLVSGGLLAIAASVVYFYRYMRGRERSDKRNPAAFPNIDVLAGGDTETNTGCVQAGNETPSDEVAAGEYAEVEDGYSARSQADDLAVKYGRGRGEMDLVLKLKGGTLNDSIKKKMKSVNAQNLSPTTLANTARKLGIGQGEITLARNLKRFNAGKSKKKKMEEFL